MELLIKGAVICIVTSLLALLLKKNTPELSLLLTLAVVAAVMTAAFSLYEEISTVWELILDRTGLERELFSPLVKIIAISLITRLGSDVCQDGGQKALASTLELVGTGCALAAAAPLLGRAMEILLRLG